MMHRFDFLALILAATGLLATVDTAAAQAAGAPPPAAAADSGHRKMDPIARMLERRDELKLTDDQARRLEAIRTKYQERHKGQMEQMRRNRDARRAFRATMDSARTEVAEVLNPAQEKQVDAMREAWRREWREAHRGRHRDGGHDHKDG